MDWYHDMYTSHQKVETGDKDQAQSGILIVFERDLYVQTKEFDG